jgi:chromosome segregation ATPase
LGGKILAQQMELERERSQRKKIETKVLAADEAIHKSDVLLAAREKKVRKELDAIIREKQQELAIQQTALLEMEEKLEDASSKVTGTSGNNAMTEELKKELADARSQADDARIKLEESRSALETAKKDSAARVGDAQKKFDNEVKESKKREAALRAQIEVAIKDKEHEKKERERLNKELTQREQSGQSTSVEVGEYRRKADDARQQADEAGKQVEQYRQQADEQKRRADALQAKMDDIKRSLHAALKQADEAKKQANQYKSRFEELKRDKEAMEAAMPNAKYGEPIDLSPLPPPVTFADDDSETGNDVLIPVSLLPASLLLYVYYDIMYQ